MPSPLLSIRQLFVLCQLAEGNESDFCNDRHALVIYSEDTSHFGHQQPCGSRDSKMTPHKDQRTLTRGKISGVGASYTPAEASSFNAKPSGSVDSETTEDSMGICSCTALWGKCQQETSPPQPFIVPSPLLSSLHAAASFRHPCQNQPTKFVFANSHQQPTVKQIVCI